MAFVALTTGPALIAIDFDDPAGRLDHTDRTLAETVCERTDVELHALLPALTPTVNLSIRTSTRVIPATGHAGSAIAQGNVEFRVDPDHQRGAYHIIETALRPTLFHECHHLVRGWVMRGGTRRRLFMEGVICEGLACAFERDSAGHALPWSDYPANVRDWVDELLWLPADAPYAKWMFCHPDGRTWIGYKAGTFIAERAIAASGRSAAGLATTDYRKILELAGLPLPIVRGWRAWFTR